MPATKLTLTDEIKTYIKKQVAHEVGKYAIPSGSKHIVQGSSYKPLYGSAKAKTSLNDDAIEESKQWVNTLHDEHL